MLKSLAKLQFRLQDCKYKTVELYFNVPKQSGVVLVGYKDPEFPVDTYRIIAFDNVGKFIESEFETSISYAEELFKGFVSAVQE